MRGWIPSGERTGTTQQLTQYRCWGSCRFSGQVRCCASITSVVSGFRSFARRFRSYAGFRPVDLSWNFADWSQEWYLSRCYYWEGPPWWQRKSLCCDDYLIIGDGGWRVTFDGAVPLRAHVSILDWIRTHLGCGSCASLASCLSVLGESGLRIRKFLVTRAHGLRSFPTCLSLS